jgi:hypothetical protein
MRPVEGTLLSRIPVACPASRFTGWIPQPSIFPAKRALLKWAMPYRTSDLLLVREKRGVSKCCPA